MREKHGLLYRAISKVLLSAGSHDGCSCELPVGGTDCCKDYGACCYKPVYSDPDDGEIGPITQPGDMICKDGVSRRGCSELRGQHGGFGSRCGPISSDGRCNMVAGGDGNWSCCLPNGQCFGDGELAPDSEFKCMCKRAGGICILGSCADCTIMKG